MHENVSQRPPTLHKYIKYKRGLAQSGRAFALGAKGRKFESCIPDHLLNGALAQLGERLICIQEVVGSIPSGSTIYYTNNGCVDLW